MKRIRVLLVDDEAAIRRGLRMLLALEPDMEVVAEAEDGTAALTAVSETKPDVVLMDIEMGAGADGITATRLIARTNPSPRVVVVSIHDSNHVRGLAARAGAAAFVGKHEGGARLVQVVREIAPPGEEDTS
jgi:DNA-binding NarL/FixJ family response regulator